MRKPEQLLWDGMKRNLEPFEDVWLKRIENAVAIGMPDVYATIKGKTAKWIELKACPLPARPQNMVLGVRYGLTPEQRNWHRRSFEFGNPSMILIRSGPKLFLVPGRFAFDVNMMNLGHMDGHFPSSWNHLLAKLRE